MGAALAAAYILIAGLCKAVFGAARHRLDARLGRPARMVILATLGGAATGLLGWALPLTLTDGAATLTPVLMQGGAIGSGVLAASCFSKMLAYHVCAECGFHGGLFLPMLSSAPCACLGCLPA